MTTAPAAPTWPPSLLGPVASLPAFEGRIATAPASQPSPAPASSNMKHIGTDTRAAAPFTLLLDTPGGEATAEADLVLDCTGTYSHPNTLGPGGIPAPGERALADHITHTLPDTDDADRWAGTVLLAGAGKSAQTAARDLAALPGTPIQWAVRERHPTGAPYRTTRCPAASISWTPLGPSPTAPTTASPSTPAPASRPSPRR